MDGIHFDKEPERYYDWMLWKMRQEDNKLKKGKSMIWVILQREGIHKYPGGIDDPKLATGDEYDVSLLVIHRHILHSGCALKCSTTIGTSSLSHPKDGLKNYTVVVKLAECWF